MTQDRPLKDIMHARGHRLTRQRRLVLDIIRESQEHLDAEAIYQRAKERDDRISLATVYRALALLKTEGLVSEHNLGEDHMHFEPAQHTPHYHFTCEVCGRVIEFEAPQVMEIIVNLQESAGLRVTSAHLMFSGTCDRCRI